MRAISGTGSFGKRVGGLSYSVQVDVDGSAETGRGIRRPHCDNAQVVVSALPPLLRRVLVVFLVCVACLPARAEPDQELVVDKVQQHLSEQVLLTAAWLDSFFDDDDYVAEENRSRLRLSMQSFWQQDEGTDVGAKLRVRVALPRFENRMMLMVSGLSEDFDTTGSEWEEVDDRVTGREDDSLTVGLRYFFRDTNRHNVSLSGGARLRSGSPILYVQPRYRYTQPLGQWDARFIQRVSWFTDAGFETRTQLQFERPVREELFFRTSAEFDWYEDEDGIFPRLDFVVRKPFSETESASLELNNFFETKPTGVLDVSILRLRFRKRIWRDWFSFEVSPQVSFPREDDYEVKAGLQLNLHADFGALD